MMLLHCCGVMVSYAWAQASSARRRHSEEDQASLWSACPRYLAKSTLSWDVNHSILVLALHLTRSLPGLSQHLAVQIARHGSSQLAPAFTGHVDQVFQIVAGGQAHFPHEVLGDSLDIAVVAIL